MLEKSVENNDKYKIWGYPFTFIFRGSQIIISQPNPPQPLENPSMASLSSTPFTSLSTTPYSTKPHFIINTATSTAAHFPSLASKKTHLVITAALSDNGAGSVVAPVPVEESPPVPAVPESDNGAVAVVVESVRFENPKWVNGTWDLTQFQKDGKTDWDAVIDAEVKRRKWLEDVPESSSNDNTVSFDTSIIPWWAWMKRFHLPEAEKLNGRAAMVGFFMAYFVDSLTGVGLVDQMGNFFCKTLLFVAVAGVLLIRKNEDVENLKKLIEETTFYDKQWQATWKEDTTGKSNRD